MTVNSRVIKTFLEWSPAAGDIPLMNGLRVQILPTISDLHRARKHQFAAFIASEALLVVWDDDALNIIQRAQQIESELMQLVWKASGGIMHPENKDESTNGSRTDFSEAEARDEEAGEIAPEQRPTMLLNTILVSFTLLLICVVLGAAFRSIAQETAVDGNYLRMAFVALTPIQIFFTLVCMSCKLFMSICTNHINYSSLDK